MYQKCLEAAIVCIKDARYSSGFTKKSLRKERKMKKGIVVETNVENYQGTDKATGLVKQQSLLMKCKSKVSV